MQATEKKTNKIWLAVLSVGVVIALILGIVALVNHGDTKANAIPTINQQVDNIKNTLPELEKVSTELKGYIDALETTTEKLQSDLTATNTAIDALETEVYGKVDAEKTATLNQLKADKTELEEKLAAANKGIKANDDAITALEATAADLQKQLDDNAEADAATKAALEADIAAINAAIEALKSKDTSIDEKIAALEAGLKKIENESLTNIDQNLAAIKGSIDDLKEVDAQLDGYIKSLQTTAADLQSKIDATNTALAALESDLEGQISASEQKVLNELNTVKTALEGQLATINNTIAALQAKDAELDQKIADLKTYVESEITATEDWARATFSTLEQYEATQTAISEINALIKNTQESIAALEKKLNKKIADDIAAVADVNSDIAAKVKEITDAYTAAIATAKEDITEAYTDAIKTAITASETSMMEWVNSTLAGGYYTKAEIDGKIAALGTQVAVGDAALQKEIDDLKAALKKAEDNLTAAYEKAIEDAVADGGVINAAIAAAVNTAQDNLQAQIDGIKSRIAAIENRLENVESQIATLFNQIQSVTFIPQYSDGKVLLDFQSGTTSLDFMINPQKLNTALVEAWKNKKDTENSIIKAYVRYTNDPVFRTGTRAVATPIELTVADVTASEGGMIHIAVKDNNPSLLSEDFWLGKQEAVVYIVITDGVTEIASEAIPMVAHNYVNATFSVIPFGDGGTHTGEAGQ